jgi:hypothetical protein
MKQDPKGQQIPGIDLTTLTVAKPGGIWGTSGVDDVRGGSFDKAARFLKDRAERDGVFDWNIKVDLNLVASSCSSSLINFFLGLDDLASERPGRSITVDWSVKLANDNMRSLAELIEEQVGKRLDKRKRAGLGAGGLTLNIIRLQ